MKELNFLNELFNKKNNYKEILKKHELLLSKSFNEVIYKLTGKKDPLNEFVLGEINREIISEINMKIIFENGIIECIISGINNQMNSYKIIFSKDFFDKYFPNLGYLEKYDFDIVLDDNFKFKNGNISKNLDVRSMNLQFSFEITENNKNII